MPVSESTNLTSAVPEGLKQDIEEAESDHFAQSYKSSVVMCRRAIQLGLQEAPHGINDGPFSRMLQEARTKTPPVLTTRTDSLVEAIKDYGDGGAH